MEPRERLLGIGKLYLKRGQRIPLDLLVEAEELVLSLVEFGLPTTLNNNKEEGEFNE